MLALVQNALAHCQPNAENGLPIIHFCAKFEFEYYYSLSFGPFGRRARGPRVLAERVAAAGRLSAAAVTAVAHATAQGVRAGRARAIPEAGGRRFSC